MESYGECTACAADACRIFDPMESRYFHVAKASAIAFSPAAPFSRSRAARSPASYTIKISNPGNLAFQQLQISLPCRICGRQRDAERVCCGLDRTAEKRRTAGGGLWLHEQPGNVQRCRHVGNSGSKLKTITTISLATKEFSSFGVMDNSPFIFPLGRSTSARRATLGLVPRFPRSIWVCQLTTPV